MHEFREQVAVITGAASGLGAREVLLCPRPSGAIQVMLSEGSC